MMNLQYKKFLFHKFEIEGKKFLFDIQRSIFLEIDDVANDILNLLNNSSYEKVMNNLKKYYARQEISETFVELKEAKILVLEPKKLQKLKANANSQPEINQIPITAMDINIAHDCNFRCKYCYGGGGNYSGPRGLMNEEIATRAVDFFLENSFNHRKCDIIFFGGEPLMNFKIIQHVVEYSKEVFKSKNKDISFGMTTNGLLLNDKIIKYLNENKIRVTISLDGAKETHDRMRKLANGKGSFEIIIPKIKTFLESRKGRMPVRATITHHNLDLKKIATYLFDVGFDNVIMSPVTALPDEDYALVKDDYQILKDANKELAYLFVQNVRKKKKWSVSPFSSLLNKIHTSNKRVLGCGGGRNYIVVDPVGDLYVCHRCVGIEDLKVGNLAEGIDRERQKKIINNTVINRQDCKNCWARYLCGGGCVFENYLYFNDITKAEKNKCDLYRYQIELAAWVYSELHEDEKKFISRICETQERPYMRVGEEMEKSTFQLARH